MTDNVPTGPWKRALTGGHTVAKVGGKMMAYYAKRPFMSGDKALDAKEKVSRDSAKALFQGLSLLKGTALKMAQQLSLENDILPEAACRELAKACHQVPPINRALVRKVIADGLGGPTEVFFTNFDSTAYAAASLGQVHRAVDLNHRQVAVKVQYPGIAGTIDSDVTLLRRMLGPVIPNEHLIPTLDEVAQRLHEEVNYEQEAENLNFFRRHLQLDGVRIPELHRYLTTTTILTTDFVPGQPLDAWLQTGPGQHDRNRVAQRLHDIFLRGVYELNALHADPNPGNFLIADDQTIDLVDFGCIKRLPAEFVEQYRLLTQSAAHNDDDTHFQCMVDIGLVPPDLPDDIRKHVESVSSDLGRWFGQLFAEEVFDFRRNTEFIRQGKTVVAGFQLLRRYFNMNTDFIFLARTRYGLLRLYEKMGAQVAFRNPFEW